MKIVAGARNKTKVPRHGRPSEAGAVFCLDGGALRGFPVTDLLVQTLSPTWDVAGHSGLQHLAKLLQVRLIEQVEVGGV